MNQWITTFKTNHLKVIDELKKETFEWRLAIGMLFMIGLSLALVYVGVHGQADLVLRELFSDFNNSELEAQIRDYLIPTVILASILAEVVWAVVWGWVTVRIMKRANKPLRFLHVLNIFMVARLYEMALGIAILLGTLVVGLYVGRPDVLVSTEGGGGQALLGLLTTIVFVWVYVWSIKHAANTIEKKKQDV